MNGTSSVYVLYSAADNRFWYAWAADELRRLEAENPRWADQATITIRFTKVLDADALKDIRARVIRESQARREIGESLARCALTEHARFAIDAGTMEVRDSQQAYEILLANGLTMVSSGSWATVLTLVTLLAAPRQREPRILVVAAYAYYAQGRFQTALGFCGEALARKAQLDAGDRDMAECVRDACECQVGRITRDEYTARQVAAAGRADASVNRRLEAVRFQYLGERHDDRREALLRQLRLLVAEVLADDSVSVACKLQARVHLAYAEGWQQHVEVSRAIHTLNIQREMGQSWATPDPRPLLAAVSAATRWECAMAHLIRETQASGVPWLHAEARRTALVVRTAMLGQRRFHATFLGMGGAPTAKDIAELIAEASAVSALFAEAGHIEGELRAKVAAADLHELGGDVAAAQAVAAEVKPVAEALGLAHLHALADQHLTRTTILADLEASIRRRRATDRDVQDAAMSDEDVEHYAGRVLAASQLPADRLPVVRRDVESMRLIAVERVRWCRHLQLLQSLFHTRHPLTAYAADPERTCRCGKHGYESLQGSNDAAAVIGRFKRAFCEDCPDRDPKVIS